MWRKERGQRREEEGRMVADVRAERKRAKRDGGKETEEEWATHSTVQMKEMEKSAIEMVKVVLMKINQKNRTSAIAFCSVV